MNPLPQAKKRKTSNIRRSTLSDIELIHQWLIEEDAAGVDGNFLCNWRVILSAHKKKELFVYIDSKTGAPVAFQLGALLRAGILQVKQNFRRQGIGRELVAHCIQLAKRRGEDLLSIQCKPSNSIPFWTRMGFTVLPDSDPPNMGYQILERKYKLPNKGIPVEVVIRFYPEKKKWTQTCPSLTQVAVLGKKLFDTIQLDRRVCFHEQAYPFDGDLVIEIETDGVSRYVDKAKYSQAEQLGVKQCANGWFIDQIHLPN